MPLKTIQPLHVKKNHPYLPVVAPDFSYTMDLMFMTGMDIYVTDEDNVTKSYKNALALTTISTTRATTMSLSLLKQPLARHGSSLRKLKVLLRLTKTTYVSSIGLATKYHAS